MNNHYIFHLRPVPLQLKSVVPHCHTIYDRIENKWAILDKHMDLEYSYRKNTDSCVKV